MAKMLTRRKVLLAKIESTYNVDPSPVEGSDAILVEDLTWSSAGLKMSERPAARPSLGALKQVYGGRLLQVNFTAEAKGSGAAGTPPEIGPLLRACGMSETIVVSTSVAYTVVSSSIESATLYIFEDGKQIKVTGCRGNAVVTCVAGEPIRAEFTMTGHEAAQTDVALASPTYDSTVPPPFNNGSFTIDSYAAVLNSLQFDLGNEVAMPASVNAADGYDEITIVRRDVNGSIDPLDELVATEDWLGNFKSGAAMALATGTIGSTAGNRIAISMPAVSYRDASMSDRDGLAAMNLPFGAGESSTDDEVTITFN